MGLWEESLHGTAGVSPGMSNGSSGVKASEGQKGESARSPATAYVPLGHCYILSHELYLKV